jgi:hypothetical protein
MKTAAIAVERVVEVRDALVAAKDLIERTDGSTLAIAAGKPLRAPKVAGTTAKVIRTQIDAVAATSSEPLIALALSIDARFFPPARVAAR